jgi:hypothetical protein
MDNAFLIIQTLDEFLIAHDGIKPAQIEETFG